MLVLAFLVAWPNLYQFSLKARFKLPGISWAVWARSQSQIAPQQTAEFLLRSIQSQMLRGETRTLMLSNRAIDAHRRRCPLQLVL